MRYAWLVLAVIGARLVTSAFLYPSGDGDLYWQRWLGQTILRTGRLPRALGPESFSAPGAPWVPQEWLFGILVAWGRAETWHWAVVAALVAAGAVGAVAIVGRRAERLGASRVAVALSATVAGLCLFESFGVRAQVVAWPLFALFLVALESEGSAFWWTIPIAAVWSNVHGSAMLAPVLAGVATAGAMIDDRAVTPRVKRFAIATVALLGAVCLNPLGIDLPRYAIALFSSPIKTYISEWQPTNISDSSFLIGSLPLLLCALALGNAARRPASERLVLVAIAFLMFEGARNIAIFGLAAVPYVAVGLTRAFGWSDDRNREASRADRLAGRALPVVGIAIAVLTGYLNVVTPQPPDIANPMPLKSMAALAAAPGNHRVLCGDFAWCSIEIGNPKISAFLDGRADPFPPSVWKDYADIVRLRDGWQARIAHYGINAIVVKRGAALDQALALTKGWRASYADTHTRLWLADGARGSR